MEVDLGVDWRAREPVASSMGPVLSVQDAVASKVGALYSRIQARDFLDVDAIRSTGRFSDGELLAAVQERDLGFEVGMFATQLAQVGKLHAEQVTAYGIDEAQWAGVVDRLSAWSDALRVASWPTRPAGSPRLNLPRT